MGVGFCATIVTTLVAPLLFVVVINWVTNAGVLVVVCPSLFVVTTTTVDWSVVENEGSMNEPGPVLEDRDGGLVVDGRELGGGDVG